MGVNDPASWDKKRIEAFLDRWTEKTAQELAHEKRVLASTKTIKPFHNELVQSDGVMDVGTPEARMITERVEQLSRQQDRPMKALDLGTFKGRSAAAIAQGMELGGKVTTVDITDEYQQESQELWQSLGIADRIDHTILPLDRNKYGGSLKLLDELNKNPQEHDSYDFAFMDGSKPNYWAEAQKLIPLMRPGGLILVDNSLYSGRVALPDNHPDAHDANTDGVREILEKIKTDPRVKARLSDEFDGILTIEKKGFREMVAKDKP